VLEVAARRAVQAWMEAVDGSDSRLRALADPAATTELLSPGDPGGRRRLVVRGIELQKIEIVALDPAAQPTATMTVDVTLRGRRYIEDRDTTEVLAGDPARSRRFVQRWTLALSHDPQEPWRIIAASTPDAVAGTAQATVGSDAARAVGP
jgi:predicted lipid-binding transport protein (Tim44 family)